jgi:hypothetical protein
VLAANWTRVSSELEFLNKMPNPSILESWIQGKAEIEDIWIQGKAEIEDILILPNYF